MYLYCNKSPPFVHRSWRCSICFVSNRGPKENHNEKVSFYIISKHLLLVCWVIWSLNCRVTLNHNQYRNNSHFVRTLQGRFLYLFSLELSSSSQVFRDNHHTTSIPKSHPSPCSVPFPPLLLFTFIGNNPVIKQLLKLTLLLPCLPYFCCCFLTIFFLPCIILLLPKFYCLCVCVCVPWSDVIINIYFGFGALMMICP